MLKLTENDIRFIITLLEHDIQECRENLEIVKDQSGFERLVMMRYERDQELMRDMNSVLESNAKRIEIVR